MTTAAKKKKKNACLHNHTVLSHSMGQQDWETSEHLTNSEILSQHKEQCMYLKDISFLVSRESFEKNLYTTIVKLKSFKKVPRATQ